ncbi:integral membrane protein [Erysiphe neolycopersici]|uniref:Integral membrane protein n=1 Tax=Erysiphe neolycopersici TaxID=212602 RepID=A0A420HF05_9PEZI|nr:integral membrane protein [Erysiphe neolycopersici]
MHFSFQISTVNYPNRLLLHDSEPLSSLSPFYILSSHFEQEQTKEMPHSSLLSRKRDLFYFTHFAIALPIVFLVDLQAIYPPWMVPEMLQKVKNYYIETYHDRFFVNPTPFFRFFISIELLYQVPVMIWGLRALYYNSPKIPLVLLPLALVTFLTTLTCMVEYAFWPQFSGREKVNLTSLYAPYLLISVHMGIDMYLRLNKLINITNLQRKKAE